MKGKGRHITILSSITIKHMILFFVGIIEMVIVTAWTKVVTKTQVLASGIVTFINILIWYYVLRVVVDDINNANLVLLYALGCALGTVICTLYYQLHERKRRTARKTRARKNKQYEYTRRLA